MEKPLRSARAHSQQIADEYLRLGWTLITELRHRPGEEPYEHLFEWRGEGPAVELDWLARARKGDHASLAWVYRWEGHKIRVAARRDSHRWERLYLDGVLAAERRGWHLWPATLAAKLADAERKDHEVRVRVGWGSRCRIWIDSALHAADSGGWFLCQHAGHLIKLSYRGGIFERRLCLYVDDQLLAEKVGKGLLPSMAGIGAKGRIQRPDGSYSDIVASTGAGYGTRLKVDSEIIFITGPEAD